MSQVELSALAHISRPRLSAAENGYLELTQDELVAIRMVIAGEPERRATKIRQALGESAISKTLAAEAMTDRARFGGGRS